MPVGQLIIEGLAMGACYGLFGLAVVIIYKTSEVVNFAAGEMAMFSTFIAFHVLTILQLSVLAGFSHRAGLCRAFGCFGIEYFFLTPCKKPHSP
ncbi:MAG: hypothetical protein MZV70_23280 [Desulfobacterales bacterium]|nr:hypothetical protein [Desulfobacterales bacterium]